MPKSSNKSRSAAILGDRLRQAAAALDGETVGDVLTVARLQHILAQSQASLGNTTEAITLMLHAYQTREARLGLNHPDTLSSRSSLFSLYQAAGQADDLVNLHEATIRAQVATIGPAQPDTLESRNNLAATFLTLSRPAPAATEFEAVLALARSALGPEHPVTLGSRNGLAEAYGGAGPDRRGDDLAPGNARSARADARPRPPRHADQPGQPGRDSLGLRPA